MENESVYQETSLRPSSRSSLLKLYCCVCSPADASPTDVELPVWTQVEEVLQQTGEILVELSVYRGATLQIRDVSTNRSIYLC